MKLAIDPGPVASCPPAAPPANARSVVTWALDPHAYCSEHEQATRADVARRLAALKGGVFKGAYDPRQTYAAAPYFVPSNTVTDPVLAHSVGIVGVHDLFGGVVPQPFVATKAITHPVPGPDAPRPAGWCTRFASEISGAALAGFSCFSHTEARRAGRSLLKFGDVRIKPVGATGGRGQTVARDAGALDRCLDAMDEAEIRAQGVVLEENLERPETYSVGQVTVAQMVVSYYGRQRLTRDNAGEAVYGGSDLTLVRGDFEVLLATSDLSPPLRHAIGQARRYHGAVIDCYPGFFASRVNYDVVQGTDSRNARRSGVLEQSWRVGGATSAEIAALESFNAHPQRHRVCASSFEVYGPAAVPADAVVSYHGVDRQVGPIAKYALLIQHADTP